MSIYKNTVVIEAVEVIANEAYGENDFGRILYEIEMNDMAFFEAVIGHDMNELNSLKEGTLLEAEVELANTEAKKSFMTKIIENFKAWLAKIKGAINNAIQNIEVAITRNDTLIKKYEQALKDGKLKDGSAKLAIFGLLKLDNSKNIDAINSCVDGKVRTVADIFGILFGQEYTAADAKTFTSIAFKNNMSEDQEVKFNDPILLKLAKEAPNRIKAMRVMAKELEDTVNESTKQFEEIMKNRAVGADTDAINNMRSCMGKLQTAYTIFTKANIAMCKKNISNVHAILKQAIGAPDTKEEE